MLNFDFLSLFFELDSGFEPVPASFLGLLFSLIE